MFEELKKRGFQIGLISNCFSEEVEAIRESILFPYFDVACLSFEKKVQKPDEAIFTGCMKELEVMPQECLYVGDGGSFELEAASKLGMNVLQATWYLREGTRQPAKRKPEFTQAEVPMEVVEYCGRF
jgi:putative hydrolase of the HAD superfamily